MERTRSRSVNYGEPPVVEVAISVRFEPPPSLNAGHLGAFWATQRASFPKVRQNAPIVTPDEDFASAGQWIPPSLRLSIADDLQLRLQMTSDDDQWMCQVQPDRLVMNWRRKTVNYPRFDVTLARFFTAWQQLKEFFRGEGFPEPSPQLWELTYVNRVPRGELWETAADWPAIFPGLWGGSFAALDGLSLRGLRGQWVWDHVPERARLYAEANPSRSLEGTSVELLMLNLTARGLIKLDGEFGRTNEDAINEGMNLGHDLIVLTFDKLASDRAQKHWQRHSAEGTIELQ